MREILFRGKRADNGELVYGNYCKAEYIGGGGYEHFIIEISEDGGQFHIDPETIKQYVGLKDKNGKRIFDGDILKIAKLMDSIGTYFDPPLEYPCNVLVRWDKCAWCWETIGKEKYFIHFPDAWCHYECEVIGNIHDNPELIEK